LASWEIFVKTRLKILVVDDESFFRNVLKDALEDQYDVIEGENGEEAIGLAKAQKPNLIIMDVEMPVKDGIDACRVLKESTETRKIPIILFTSLSGKEDIVRGLKVGADDYITKPMCLPEILARVGAHLRPKDYYSDLEQRDLILLLELAENISAIRNPVTILHLIVERMSDMIDNARCSIVSIKDDGVPYVKASSDLEVREEIKLELCKYPEISKALNTKQPVIINDIKNDPLMDSVRTQIEGLNFNSIVVIPVIKKESVIGTFLLRMATPLPDGVTKRIHKLCQLVANHSANALETAILFESMKTTQEHFEEMSIRDGLTRLYNHQHFYNCLENEFSRSSRYHTPLSLVFFDIDDFKRINDNYGHIQGDTVLREIGKLTKSVARLSDVPARYGGEEFAVVLPNTTAEGAQEMATRLSSIIRDHAFEGLDGEQITISSGTSTYTGKSVRSCDQLVQLADKAMYQAKLLGKDRISQD
jgi:two-component system cell cycle response regulator